MIRNILLAAGGYTSQDAYEYLLRKAVLDFMVTMMLLSLLLFDVLS